MQHGSASSGHFPRPLRILLAEDHPVSRKLAQHILASQGHEVVPVADGLAALEAWTADSFDLVVMDVEMPQLDGIEAVRCMRRRESGRRQRTPVIVLSASRQREDREQLFACGIDFHLPKPYTSEQLLAAVGRSVIPCSPATAGSAVLDLQRGLEYAEGDAAFYRELARMFITDMPAVWQRLLDASRHGDREQAGRAAHRLRGSAMLLGAMRLADAAWALEIRCCDGAGSEMLSADIDALDRALLEACEALSQLLRDR